MVTFVTGNMFDSPAQVITNPVNCVGATGKGLSLEFERRYPELSLDYKERCNKGLVKPGFPYLWENEATQILNFPTKRHWRGRSQIEDIEVGLKYLASRYQEMGIYTLALPALGCGHGGLEWKEVKPLIEKHLGPISDLEVFVYEPYPPAGSKKAGRNEKKPSSEQRMKIAASPV